MFLFPYQNVFTDYNDIILFFPRFFLNVQIKKYKLKIHESTSLLTQNIN